MLLFNMESESDFMVAGEIGNLSPYGVLCILAVVWSYKVRDKVTMLIIKVSH